MHVPPDVQCIAADSAQGYRLACIVIGTLYGSQLRGASIQYRGLQEQPAWLVRVCLTTRSANRSVMTTTGISSSS